MGSDDPFSRVSAQVELYPTTRFMGSKRKLLPEICRVVSKSECDSVADVFSGSGVVSYLFKAMGKEVVSNDYMAMAAAFTKATVENSTAIIADDLLQELISPAADADRYVETTFQGLYFADEDNRFIDSVRANIKRIDDPRLVALAKSALIRACMKRRPRGIFTYTGNRYDDGRKDLRLSLKRHFIEAVELFNGAVFDNGKPCRSVWGDALDLKAHVDLVYIDPPYYSPYSDNEYVRRYHFVEGIARDWNGVEIQQHTKTKKFKSYPTPFSTRTGTAAAFDALFGQYADSVIVVSYSSNGLPTKQEMIDLLKHHKGCVDIVPVDYRYSFGNKNRTSKNEVQEYLFVGY